MSRALLLSGLALLLLIACGDDDGGGVDASEDAAADTTPSSDTNVPSDTATLDTARPEDTATPPDTSTPDTSTPTDTGTPPDDTGEPPMGEWMTLVEGDWRLDGGEEAYYCARATVRETIYIAEFEAIAPLGTHHTVLTTTDPGSPDGITRCSVATNGDAMIYGSGVGTTPLEMPPGVAVKVEAGQQVLVNLHLFNTARSPLSGTSGIRVRVIPRSAVEHEAEVVLAGEVFQEPIGTPIPARSRGHVKEGHCTMAGDTTIFAVMPHMHQLGTFMRVESRGRVLYNSTYSFDDQVYSDISPMLEATRGQRVNVECTYDNPTSSPVPWGDSSTEEMCFALLYRYPALNEGGIICTRLGTF